MRTAIAFLCLAGAAFAQGKKIEGTARESVADRRPVLVCEGTTDLPDGSRFDVRVYFGQVEQGRHLFQKAIEVKDGKFSAELPVFARQTLKGHYLLHVEFNPYLQDAGVQQKLGKQLRHYEGRIPLTIGTEKEIDEDRHRVKRQLGAEVEILKGIVAQADAKLAQKPSEDEWERAAKEWSEMIHQVENRCHDVAEYRALRLDDLSEQSIEDLAHCVERVIASAGLCRAKPGDAEAAKQLDEHRKGFDWMRRPVALRLGLEKATAEEMRKLIPDFRTPVLESAGLYVKIIKKPDPDQREYFKAMLLYYQQQFREHMLGLAEVAPEPHLESVRTLLEKGTEFFRVVDAAKEMKENRKDEVLDAQKAFAAVLEAFEASLKE